MKLSVKLCLVAIAAYFLAAAYGEVQYRIALGRDATPTYNAVHADLAYLPPLTTATFPDTGERHFFLLGSDNLGRDVALRLVQGARIAFHVGVMTSLIAIPLGVLLGLVGGYFGGRVDSFVVWLCATVASMPGLLFILAISMVVGQGLAGIYLGIGLTTWVGVCRTIRAEVMKHRDRAYVQAARVLGYSHARRAGRAELGRDDKQRAPAPLAGRVVGDGGGDGRDLRAGAGVQPSRGLAARRPGSRPQERALGRSARRCGVEREGQFC